MDGIIVAITAGTFLYVGATEVSHILYWYLYLYFYLFNWTLTTQLFPWISLIYIVLPSVGHFLPSPLPFHLFSIMIYELNLFFYVVLLINHFHFFDHCLVISFLFFLISGCWRRIWERTRYLRIDFLLHHNQYLYCLIVK